ncbi:DUF3575 domain-containing protein [Spongiimicrobium salis]|uniref:DUF3575 domain-containing protein n=1 Tax=Spongiimicrobium salis TaxID=1667022 RepID=UPI00374D57DE
MRKRLTVLLLFSILFYGFGQHKDSIPQHEIKLNVFNLLAFYSVSADYEYLLNEEGAIGGGFLFHLDRDDDFVENTIDFALTGFYRHFFTGKYAQGFFVEGFGMLNSGQFETFDFSNPSTNSARNTDSYTDIALGIAIGGKFVSPRGFITEVFLGLGRNVFRDGVSPDIVPRIGISLGYRF